MVKYSISLKENKRDANPKSKKATSDRIKYQTVNNKKGLGNFLSGKCNIIKNKKIAARSKGLIFLIPK